MPFVERTQFDLPLIFNPDIARARVEYSEYSHPVESSQAIVEDSDAVVIDLRNRFEETFSSIVPTLSNQESEFLLQSVSADSLEASGYAISSFTSPLESYQVANRWHRFPVYGSLIIDVYV